MLSEHMSADVLADGGDMGALMRSIDWAKTPLGPVSRLVPRAAHDRRSLAAQPVPDAALVGTAVRAALQRRVPADPGREAPEGDGPDGRRMLGGDLARHRRRWSRRRSAASRRRPATIWSCSSSARASSRRRTSRSRTARCPTRPCSRPASAACWRPSPRRRRSCTASGSCGRCARWARRAADAKTPEQACAKAAATLGDNAARRPVRRLLSAG